jgi:hypothetical protein
MAEIGGSGVVSMAEDTRGDGGSAGELVVGNREGDVEDAMDVEIWKDLQHRIDMRNVYERLPFREFFQLRSVCKDWNRLASERRCFKDLIPKPYFVLNPSGIDEQLNGILTYNISSGHWCWNQLPQLYFHGVNHPDGAFSVEGLVCSSKIRVGLSELRVFDVHTKAWHTVPPAPETNSESGCVGIAVDTSVKPYTFKIIQGGSGIATQIYDSTSNVWKTAPAQPLLRKTARLTKCTQCNDQVYIRMNSEEVLVYNLNKQVWSNLKTPKQHPEHRECRTLGAWRGRIFDIVENHDGSQFVSVTVWELVDQSRQEWRVYDHMPAHMYKFWLRADKDSPSAIRPDDLEILTSFCGDYALVYAWINIRGWADRFCLYNLATKKWEKVYMPFGTVRIDYHYYNWG